MDSLTDRIVLEALKNAPFDGWNAETLKRAAMALGQSAMMADALFPDGAASATQYVSAYFDRKLAERLQGVRVGDMRVRVRERIAKAVETRLEIMTPYKAGLKVALAHWANPRYAARAAKTLWASADKIWVWAGDTSTDYNRYTKRGLLSGVMFSAMLYWLQDISPNAANTRAFIDRRIENVLTLGRIMGKRKAA